MIWVALQVILGHLCHLPNFWNKKSKFLGKKPKSSWINYHFTPASQTLQSLFLKNDVHIITGYSWPIIALLFHFWSKIKISEKWKNAKNLLKILKITNILKVTIISHVIPQTEWGQTFCQFWVIFLPLPHFWPKKSKFSKNEIKIPRNIIILLTLRSLINVGIKINVGVRDFL